ncbi:lipoprotein-releasing ABC transporter permease subunit [Sessilibacter sp. MAH1]
MIARFSPVSLFIGLRYLKAKRRNQFISFISTFSLIGMAFGVFALIVVLSVMNGFDREIKERILSVVPHGFVRSEQGIDDWSSLRDEVFRDPDVTGAAPYIEGYGLLNYGYGIQGVNIQGIDPSIEPSVSSVAEKMVVGELDNLQPGEFGIVIGRLLARYLGVTTGDKITLVLPQVSITPAGVFPRQKRVIVVGVFEIGAQQDQTLALINIHDAQKLFRFDAEAEGLRIATSDLYSAQAVLSRLQSTVSQETTSSHKLEFLDWSQTQGGLFQAVKMEKIVVGSLLMIIIAVAAFNIITSLILMVSDKRSDIAVLRTMGLSAAEVMAIFIVQGTAVGVIGILMGGVLGSLCAVYVGDIVQFFESVVGTPVFDPNVYFVSKLPSLVMINDVFTVAGVGFVLATLATLYPARQAAKIQPADALRYE